MRENGESPVERAVSQIAVARIQKTFGGARYISPIVHAAIHHQSVFSVVASHIIIIEKHTT